jgi:hypothetical protein
MCSLSHAGCLYLWHTSRNISIELPCREAVTWRLDRNSAAQGNPKKSAKFQNFSLGTTPHGSKLP